MRSTLVKELFGEREQLPGSEENHIDRLLLSKPIDNICYKDERSKKMKDVCPRCGYGDTEEGRKDNFDKTFGKESSGYYAGKEYPDGATELLAMGLEALYKDPQGFAQRDPEYVKMLMRILKGKHLR